MEQVSEMELTDILGSINWKVLRTKNPEYIVTIIARKLKMKGVQCYKEFDRKRVTVVPVTGWDPKDPVKHDTEYVYEIWRGVQGEILKERKVGDETICTVRLEPEGKRKFVTEIKKQDLCSET